MSVGFQQVETFTHRVLIDLQLQQRSLNNLSSTPSQPGEHFTIVYKYCILMSEVEATAQSDFTMLSLQTCSTLGWEGLIWIY